MTTASEGDEPNRYVVVEPGLSDLARGRRRDARADGARPRRRPRASCSTTRCAPSSSSAASTGPIVDVGSGGGAPGHPARAARCPSASSCCSRRSAASASSSSAWAPPNARVVWGRAEEQETDWAGVALAKALAPPPVAAEWCLPLVRPGGIAVLWVGETAEPARVARVAASARGRARPSRPPGLLVLRKLGPTPPGFPRRTGVARKRPLA